MLSIDYSITGIESSREENREFKSNKFLKELILQWSMKPQMQSSMQSDSTIIPLWLTTLSKIMTCLLNNTNDSIILSCQQRHDRCLNRCRKSLKSKKWSVLSDLRSTRLQIRWCRRQSGIKSEKNLRLINKRLNLSMNDCTIKHLNQSILKHLTNHSLHNSTRTQSRWLNWWWRRTIMKLNADGSSCMRMENPNKFKDDNLMSKSKNWKKEKIWWTIHSNQRLITIIKKMKKMLFLEPIIGQKINESKRSKRFNNTLKRNKSKSTKNSLSIQD